MASGPIVVDQTFVVLSSIQPHHPWDDDTSKRITIHILLIASPLHSNAYKPVLQQGRTICGRPVRIFYAMKSHRLSYRD